MSLITKIHLLVDAQGRPVRFSLTGGQRAYVSQAIPLLTGIETGAVIADKGYESNRVLAFIRDQGAEAVIPPKSNRRDPWEYDRELCRERNLIERAFNKLKQWRRIATRYDRRSLYFLSALHLVASVIWGLKLSIRPSITTTVQGGRPEAARDRRRRGAWYGSIWFVRYTLAYPRATAATYNSKNGWSGPLTSRFATHNGCEDESRIQRKHLFLGVTLQRSRSTALAIQ